MEGDVTDLRRIYFRLETEGADAPRIASMTRSIWNNIEAALSPIVGHAGVIALFKRSIYLTAGDYGFLRAVLEGGPDGFADLEAVLSQQTSSVAAAAGEAQLREFCALLTKLIGASLTGRLLQSVWDPSNGDAGRDITP